MAKSGQRHVNDAGAQLCQLLRRQAAAAQGSGPVTLGENVGLADQPKQRVQVALLAQIQVGG